MNFYNIFNNIFLKSFSDANYIKSFEVYSSLKEIKVMLVIRFLVHQDSMQHQSYHNQNYIELMKF